ncbi:MAG: CPBP family intramembrane metalloprotease [Sandaracinus sp.]|nr:CPBP family intramembrane metalloprotease [Sandaracinus sp.]MCB9616169.1 CPBP family intramembrane metalloprotease [Sandaracinus sp.]MCB9618054.1 CPBP family intramembrane metalloprotease [Sandaracinus sp.]MCB9624073.1 CPBP family intramembrane metalloprotease [Sandaracinus sp.]
MAATSIRWHAALGYVLLAVLGSFGAQLLAALVRTTRGLDLTSAAAAVQRDPLSLGLAQLFGFGLALAVARRVHARGPRREVYALAPTSTPVVMLAGLAGVVLQLPLAEVGNLMHELFGRDAAHARAVQDLLRADSAFDGFAVALALVVVAPVTEELLFRGVLLPGLAKAYGERLGLAVSAVLFGVMHGRPAEAVVATAAGFVLGALRLRTRSLLPCVALHVGVNALPVLVPADVFPIPGVNVWSDEILHVPPEKVVAAAAAAALALVMAMRFDDERR